MRWSPTGLHFTIIYQFGLQPKGLWDFLHSIKPRNCKTIKKKKNKWQF